MDAGDDAAVLDDGTVVTVDTMVEGVHFDDRSTPGDVGWKLVAVNASDLGAMGARPAWAVLSVSLPTPLDQRWVADFAWGLGAALGEWSISLVGGDTTRSPGPRVLSLTMGGKAGRLVLRSGARPGEDLWVTGTLGDASLGFAEGGEGLAWLRRPHPPVTFALALAQAGLATAMMDLSDGLATDLPRLCAASGVGACVDPSHLPLSPAVAESTDPLGHQVAFGDDYQLLFAAHPESALSVQALARGMGQRVTKIGELTSSKTVTLTGHDRWPEARFQHFQETR